jgi:hypothetical protein
MGNVSPPCLSLKAESPPPANAINPTIKVAYRWARDGANHRSTDDCHWACYHAAGPVNSISAENGGACFHGTRADEASDEQQRDDDIFHVIHLGFEMERPCRLHFVGWPPLRETIQARLVSAITHAKAIALAILS